MTGRQIRRLLYGLLVLALFVIVLHSGRTAYWLAKDGHYSERPHFQTDEILADYNDQQVSDIQCYNFENLRRACLLIRALFTYTKLVPPLLFIPHFKVSVPQNI